MTGPHWLSVYGVSPAGGRDGLLDLAIIGFIIGAALKRQGLA